MLIYHKEARPTEALKLIIASAVFREAVTNSHYYGSKYNRKQNWYNHIKYLHECVLRWYFELRNTIKAITHRSLEPADFFRILFALLN